MSDDSPEGAAGTPGGQLGKSGVGGGEGIGDPAPIQPVHDAGDTAPFRNAEGLGHRAYIPATWAAAGHGGGSPKLSGGVEIDIRSGMPTPRGLNRPGQRYEQPSSTMQANRKSRANAEYATSVILQGEGGQFEVHSASGNNYDIAPNLVTCDCPDWYKQEASGYGIVRCKHIYLVIKALSDPLFADGLNWSCAKWAQVTGIDERTVQRLCQEGFIPATKILGVWVIEPIPGQTSSALYKLKMWPF